MPGNIIIGKCVVLVCHFCQNVSSPLSAEFKRLFVFLTHAHQSHMTTGDKLMVIKPLALGAFLILWTFCMNVQIETTWA